MKRGLEVCGDRALQLPLNSLPRLLYSGTEHFEGALSWYYIDGSL